MSTSVKPFPGARHSRGPKSLAQRLGEAWGRTPGGASQLLYNKVDGLPARMEKLVFDLIRFNNTALARHIVQRLVSIVEGRQPAPYSAQLVMAEVEADAEQDKARDALLLALADNDPENDRAAAQVTYRKLKVEIERKTELMQAIGAHWGIG